ncbi:hypothetical protein [uncultured Lactobacillus sp.]|uniref:hypothetical protein n=1 Tax=uncultured Lactobacillus sp. TaxID=153152 RepID=UPI002590E02A|nr:hypothetical protein [uncultured Lactobacillus sp.]
MLQNLTMEQMREIRNQRIAKEQDALAEQGISSAIENGEVVTIGNADCDYLDFKHFIVAQIAQRGFAWFIDKTGWDKDELIEDLAEQDSSNTVWQDDVEDFFNGKEGNY